MVPDAQSKKSILDVPDPHFRVSNPFEVGHETLAYQSRHELREEELDDRPGRSLCWNQNTVNRLGPGAGRS